MFLGLLIVFAAFPTALQRTPPNKKVCDKFDIDKQTCPVPTLPQSWLMKLEVVQPEDRKRSVEEIYYDHLNSVVGIVKIRGASKTLHLYNFKLKTFLASNEKDSIRKCSIKDLGTSFDDYAFALICASIDEGNAFRPNSSDCLLTNKSTTEVRGIPTTKFNQCIRQTSNTSIFVQSFWSDSGRYVPASGLNSSMPLKIIQIAESKNSANDSIVNNATIISNIFSLSSTLQDGDNRFSVPYNLRCNVEDCKDCKDSPDIRRIMGASSYAIQYEAVYHKHNKWFTELPRIDGYHFEWYSKTYGLFRWNYRRPCFPGNRYCHYQMSLIQDYNSNVSYVVNRSKKRCTISGLRDTQSFSSNPSLFLDFIHEFDGSEWTFKSHNDDVVPSDVWTTTLTKSEFRNRPAELQLQMQLLSPPWKKYGTDPDYSDPLRVTEFINFSDDKIPEWITLTKLIRNFDDRRVTIDDFDVIDPCLFDVVKRSFVFAIDGETIEASSDISDDVILALADSSRITPLRFHNLMVLHDAVTEVIFSVSDPPKLTDSGRLTSNVTIDQVVRRIIDQIDNDKFIIVEAEINDKWKILKAEPFSFREVNYSSYMTTGQASPPTSTTTRIWPTPSHRPKGAHDDAYNTGTIIAFCFLGMFLGSVIVVLAFKIFRKYQSI
ncbi:Uncharacterised protein g338 [Pycnogonum litorale]